MTQSDAGNVFYAIKDFFDQYCGTDYFFVDTSSAGTLSFTISDDASGTTDFVAGTVSSDKWTLTFDESDCAAEADATDGEEVAAEIMCLITQAMLGTGLKIDPRGSSSDRDVDIDAAA